MNDKSKSNDKIKRRRRQVRIRIILLILLLIVCTVAAVILIIKLTPTSKRMSYEEYFGQMKENEAAIVLQDQIITDTRAAVSDSGSVYLPHEFVRSCLNERFFWDEENGEVLFTTATQTYVIPVGTASYTVIDGALPDDPSSEASYSEDILIRGADNTLYLSLSFLSQYTDIAWTYNEDSHLVFIRNSFGPALVSEAAKEAAVRYRGGIKSPIIADLLKGEQVTVLEQGENWMKVQTKDGWIGWVKSNRMAVPFTTELKNEGFTPVEYPSITMDGKVSLVWHMISSQSENKTLADAVDSMTGVNVISPTWFSLADNDGNVDSIGSKTYVDEAHRRSLQVWGLVDDFSPDMDNSVMLASTAARRSCISQLIGYADTLGLDGINIDFEHIDPGDAYTYTQFVRELSIACRRASLVLSVDTYPPYDFNAYLNRKEIAAVCDYLINMGYDEHYVGSESTGSVASLGFEEGAIQNLLLMGVPADKLISAVPFYTRIWYTSRDEEGNTYINSEELSMNSVSATLDSWNLTPDWDPVTAQNYVSWYTDDGVLCEIWIEDAASLQRKLLIVSGNNLAGTAIWALGFQNDSVWGTLSETLAMSQEEASSLAEKLKQQDTTALQDTAESSTEAEVPSSEAAVG